MVNLALSLWIFRPLDGESDPAVITEGAASIFLPGGQSTPVLITLCIFCTVRQDPLSDNQRRLQVKHHRTLQAEGVMGVKPPEEECRQRQCANGKKSSGAVGLASRAIRQPSPPLWSCLPLSG